jgi:hypothetical protein
MQRNIRITRTARSARTARTVKQAVVTLALVACFGMSPAAPAAFAQKANDGGFEPIRDPNAAHASLGKIKVGDYEVEVIQEGKIEAGKEATFQLKVAGSPEPKAIRVWVGVESGRGSTKGKAHKHGDEIEVHADVPTPLPADAKVWVEIETDAGKAKAGIAYKVG